MNKLDFIKGNLIRTGFRELRFMNVSIDYSNSPDYYFAVEGKWRSHHIEVDESLRNVSNLVLEGGIAHELGHLIRDYQTNPLKRLLGGEPNENDPDYERYDERATDMLVIERGFGSQLLAFVQYHNKRRKKYKKEDGLTEKEIKSVLSGKDVEI